MNFLLSDLSTHTVEASVKQPTYLWGLKISFFYREPREEAYREDRPAPGAREVRRVDSREPVAEHDEGAPDPGRGDEKRDGEEELDDEQPGERPERPGQLQHVEGEALGDREAGGGGAREREGGEGEKGSGG